jgi:hypothetical protein
MLGNALTNDGFPIAIAHFDISVPARHYASDDCADVTGVTAGAV